MIRFNCPECGKSLGVPEKFAGRSGECNGCKSRIRIPVESEEELFVAEVEEFPEVLPAPVITRESPPRESVATDSTADLRMWLKRLSGLTLSMAFLYSLPMFLLSVGAFLFGMQDEAFRRNARAVGGLAFSCIGMAAGALVVFVLFATISAGCLYAESMLRLAEKDSAAT